MRCNYCHITHIQYSDIAMQVNIHIQELLQALLKHTLVTLQIE